MPAKKVVKKKSAKKASKKAARRSGRSTKRAAAPRSATRGRKPTKSVAKRVRPRAAAKSARAQVIEIEERPIPSTHPGPDPKAEQTREHMKHMREIESQRNEERHRMTRFRRNTP